MWKSLKADNKEFLFINFHSKYIIQQVVVTKFSGTKPEIIS